MQDVDTATEWVDEDMMVATSKKPKKLQKCFTLVDSNRLDMQSGSKAQIGIQCKFSGQKNHAVFNLMKELDITAIYTPDGYTGYVQPMDSTIINNLVRDKMADILEESLAYKSVRLH